MNTAKALINLYKSKIDVLDLFLAKPATQKELDEVEKITGLIIPQTLKDLLSITNGGGNETYSGKGLMCAFELLSTQEIISYWNFFNGNIEKDVYQKELLNSNLYGKSRLPFAHDGSGQHLCIDYMPEKKGKMGQIIYLPCAEPEPMSVIFKDFDEYIDFVIESLNSSRLKIQDERTEWEDWDEDDWENIDLHVYKTWKDDWTDIADEYNERNKL